MPNCLTCGQPFPDYRALAEHIFDKRKSHKKGLRWAAKFLMNQRKLDKKATQQNQFQNRSPLTHEDYENKRSTQRELSGELAIVKTFCPSCKNTGTCALPVEYAGSPTAWKVGEAFYKLCNVCGRE